MVRRRGGKLVGGIEEGGRPRVAGEAQCRWRRPICPIRGGAGVTRRACVDSEGSGLMGCIGRGVDEALDQPAGVKVHVSVDDGVASDLAPCAALPNIPNGFGSDTKH